MKNHYLIGLGNFVICLLTISFSYAQTQIGSGAPFDEYADCSRFCNKNDFALQEFFLSSTADGKSKDDVGCEGGKVVSAYLCVTVSPRNLNSRSDGFYVSGRLLADGSYFADLSHCFNQEVSHANVTLCLDEPIDYNCITELSLADVYFAWTPSNRRTPLCEVDNCALWLRGTCHEDDETYNVSAPLMATFTSAKDCPVADEPQMMHFSMDAVNETGIMSYEWDFGDGTTSTEASPSHQYAEAGQFMVSLTLEDEAGQRDVEVQMVECVDCCGIGLPCAFESIRVIGTPPPDGIETCDRTPCTSGAMHNFKVYLADENENPLTETCELGTMQEAYVCIDFISNPDTQYDLFLEGVFTRNGIESDSLIHCEDIDIQSGLNTICLTETFEYVCGEELFLTDIFVAWGHQSPGICDESNGDCFRGSKCRGTIPDILIRGPLVPNFELISVCNDGDLFAQDTFISTTTGGTMPYTYTWDFGDGNPTSTLECMDKVDEEDEEEEYDRSCDTLVYKYNNPGTYTVTLIVEAADGNTEKISLEVESMACCTFSATCDLSAEPQSIEGCSADDATPKEEATDVFSDIEICGDTLFIVNTLSEGQLCPENVDDSLTVIFTYLLVDDLNSNGAPDTSAMDDPREPYEICMESYIIRDDTAPNITCPVDVTIACDEDSTSGATGSATATDNCSSDTNITISQSDVSATGTCANESTITRTWTATDECGNAATCAQTITITDTSAPTAPAAPADATAQCIAAVSTPGDLTATDNCSVDITVTGVDSDNGGTGCLGDPLVITRTWTFVDDCDNSSSVSQTITVLDETAPTAPTAPADATAQCITDVSTSGDLTATDNCSADITVTGVDSDNGGSGCLGDPLVITRTWTFVDECDNSSSVSQTITIVDNTAPTAPTAPADATAQCITDVSTPGDLTATDNCSADITVTGVDSDNGGSGCLGDPLVITRTWTFVDECDNSSIVSQTITIVDNTAPTAPTAPADATAQCITDVSTPGDLTATDNCSADITVTGVDSDNGGSGCLGDPLVITRTWTFLDDCDNSSSVFQTITVVDETAPTAPTAPADATAQCITDVSTPGDLTATDNCSADITVTGVDSDNGGSGCLGDPLVITRTWTFVDECDNSSNVSQTITVVDDTAPTAPTAPADATAQCIAAVSTPGDLTATDNCSADITVTGVDSDNGGSGCLGDPLVITRTWTFLDDCDNSSSVFQTITVVDDTAPEITCPDDLTIECDQEIPDPNIGLVNVSDNCTSIEDITIEHISTTSDNGVCPETITRIYQATDACGNTSRCTQTITRDDTIDPTFIIPDNVTISCNESTEPSDTGEPTGVDDNCDTSPEVTSTDTDCFGNFDEEDISAGNRKYFDFEVSGLSGLSASDIQQVCVSFETNKGKGNAELVLISPCGDAILLVGEYCMNDSGGNCDDQSANTKERYDPCFYSCSSGFDQWNNDDPIATGDGQFIPHGGIASNDQDIDRATNWVDCFEDISCTEINGTWSVYAQKDNTASGTVSFLGACLTPGNCIGEQSIIIREWKVTDQCNNMTTGIQIISIDDTVKPVIKCPENIGPLVCGEALPEGATTIEEFIQQGGTVSDDCSSIFTISFEDSGSGGGSDICDPNSGGVIMRTYTITDECGNAEVCTQTITFEADDNDPVFVGTLPSDVTVTCLENVPTVATLTATDDCDTDVIVSFDENETSDATACKVIARTWTAADDCQNEITHTQTIRVEDKDPPTFSPGPEDITVDCHSITTIELNEPLVSDNCEGVQMMMNDDEITPGDCPQEMIVSRTWTATDACGNTNVFEQLITIQDTLAPTIVTCPDDVTVDCGGDISPTMLGVAEAEDNCQDETSIDITNKDENISSDPSIIIIRRTWYAEDACGNIDSCFQLITQEDCCELIFACDEPANTLFACQTSVPDANSTLPEVTASCYGNPRIEVKTISNEAAGCVEDTLKITHRYIITDDDNDDTTEDLRDSCEIVYAVVDNIVPVFTFCPKDTTINCGTDASSMVLGKAEASDNCAGLPSISESSQIKGNDECAYENTITRTWVATDACGNKATCVQLIMVVDTVAPIITCPTDMTVACDLSIDPDDVGSATATDNCSIAEDVTVDHNDVNSASTIQRTWTATDACGNSTSCVQIITREACCELVISCGDPDGGVYECLEDVPAPDESFVTIVSSCYSPSIEVQADISGGGCIGDTLMMVRRFIVTDSDGNTATLDQKDTCYQTIKVVDDKAPVFVEVPADGTIDCNANPVFGVPTVEDNCSETVEENSCVIADAQISQGKRKDGSDVSADRSDPASLSELGDGVFFSLGFGGSIIVEFADPVSGVLSIKEVTNSASYPLEQASVAVSTDGVNFTEIGVATNQVPDQLNEFTLSGCVRYVRITDTSDESIHNATADAFDIDAVCASSTCGQSEVTIEFEDSSNTEGCAGGTVTRTWTATDACGNSSTASQTLTYDDTTDPTLTNLPLAEVELNCGDGTSGISEPVVSDNCDDSPIITFEDSGALNDCSTTSVIVRTWKVTDACGNFSTANQTIRRDVDTQAPILICAKDTVINCGVDTSATALNLISTATDNCDSNPIVTYTDVASTGDCDTVLYIQRTWTATDICNRSASCVQHILVQDTIAPVIISCARDTLVDCHTNLVPEYLGTPMAQDDCGGEVTFDYEDNIPAESKCIDGVFLTRTWTASDACGNQSTCEQIIMIQDTVAPTLTCPIKLTVYVDATCLISSADTMPVNSGIPSVSDNCSSGPGLTYVDELVTTGYCTGSGEIRRTWTADDFCGNTSSCEQIITFLDTIPPSITCPADMTVACEDSIDPDDIGSATATDNCSTGSDLSVAHSDVNVSASAIQRTWTATDACGNSASCVQIITREACCELKFECTDPANKFFSCKEDVSNPEDNTPTISASCFGNAKIETKVFDNGASACLLDTLKITHRYIVTDDDGDDTTEDFRDSCEIVYAVVDNIVPVFTFCPKDTLINCGIDASSLALGKAQASDNCEGVLSISETDQIKGEDGCAYENTITRTWVATDACGNKATCSQLIMVRDTVAPVITCPASVTVACDESIDPDDIGSATATDNCSIAEDITVDHNDVNSASTIQRTWTATDACGNSTTCVQIITREACCELVISCGDPDGGVYECLEDVPAPDESFVTIVSSCHSPTVEVQADITGGGCIGDTLMMVRRFIVTDSDGNTATLDQKDTCYQTIKVVDDEAPVFVEVPADGTIECNTNPVFGVPTVEDNCDMIFGRKCIIASSDIDQGQRRDGSDVITERSDPASISAADDGAFYSLGFGGTITIAFASPVEGNLRISEVTNKPYPLEKATIEVSSDGVIFTMIGTAQNNTSPNEFTLTNCIQYVKITDTSDPNDYDDRPEADGFDIDAVCASQGCDEGEGISVTVQDSSDPDANCAGGTVTRTWTATDLCGNSTSESQTLTYVDIIPPTIEMPANVTLDCDEGTSGIQEPNVSDNCGGTVTLSHEDDGSLDNCSSEVMITRTWKAKDECGNISTKEQKYIDHLMAPHLHLILYLVILLLNVTKLQCLHLSQPAICVM